MTTKSFLKYFIFPALSLTAVFLISAKIFIQAADINGNTNLNPNPDLTAPIRPGSSITSYDYNTTQSNMVVNANCNNSEYAWQCGTWSECLLESGTNQYRQVRLCPALRTECSSLSGQGGMVLQPNLTRTCEKACESFSYTEWGECRPNSAGVFLHTRTILNRVPPYCVTVTTSSASIPKLEEECRPDCVEDDWNCTEYPLVCPSAGRLLRQCNLKPNVICEDRNNSKPSIEKPCTPKSICGRNTTGSWSDCGNGKQTRPKYDNHNDCIMPLDVGLIEEQECCDDITFRAGLDWSLSCGPGMEYRYKIYKGNNQACLAQEKALTMTQKRASGYMSERCSAEVQTDSQTTNDTVSKIDLPKTDKNPVVVKPNASSTEPDKVAPAETRPETRTTTIKTEQPSPRVNVSASKATDDRLTPSKNDDVAISNVPATTKTPENVNSQANSQASTNQTQALAIDSVPPINKAETQAVAASLQAVKNISADCGLAQITNSDDCEIYIRQNTIVDECLAKNIKSRGECRSYFISNYGRPAKCAKVSEATCLNLINNVILAGLSQETVSPTAKEDLIRIAGQSATIDSQKDKIILSNQTEVSTNLLPLAPQESPAKVKLLSAPTDTSESIAPVAIAFDNDGDGLPNDLEDRLGTKIDNPDTDGDGYADGQEVATGNNPLGAGKMDSEFKAKIAPIDSAMMQNKPIEHPRYAKVSSSLDLLVSKIELVRTNETLKTGEVRLKGKANPNEVVSVFIYSAMPIIVTAKADANGNWVYNLDKTLIDGNHEIYVAINDDSGKVVSRSAVMNFIIKEAQAVTMDDYIQVAEAPQPKDNSTNMVQRYVWGGVILVVVCILLFFAAIRPKKDQPSL
ncbi:MAG: Ig-like domain-containing protein [Patescibacteria group bacterium]|nr:Ig-like domain-containing protein [Patescibacteria group bacterium]